MNCADENFYKALIWAAFILSAIACINLLGACGPKCKPLDARCFGNNVQVCAPNKKWETVVDCSKLLKTEKKWCCKCLDNEQKRCGCMPDEGTK